jgi:hypothetical protein
MIIETMLENYELYKNELEADLYLLQTMLQQHMPEPSGDTIELGRVLKHLKGCADFVNDAAVDHRLRHAEMRFRQLSYLDWLIRSRANLSFSQLPIQRKPALSNPKRKPPIPEKRSIIVRILVTLLFLSKETLHHVVLGCGNKSGRRVLLYDVKNLVPNEVGLFLKILAHGNKGASYRSACCRMLS